MAARAVEQRINADTSDHGGPTAPCPRCGQPARYVDRRAKTVTSVLGALTIQRAYFHCDPCAAGFCPRDAALGVAGTSLSPGVLRMVGLGLLGAALSRPGGRRMTSSHKSDVRPCSSLRPVRSLLDAGGATVL